MALEQVKHLEGVIKELKQDLSKDRDLYESRFRQNEIERAEL